MFIKIFQQSRNYADLVNSLLQTRIYVRRNLVHTQPMWIILTITIYYGHSLKINEFHDRQYAIV